MATCETCGPNLPCGTPVQWPLDILSPLINQGMDMNLLIHQAFRGLSRYLFEEEYIGDNGSVAKVYRLKSGIGLNNYSAIKVSDDCAAVWYETTYSEAKAVVAVDAAIGATDIVVEDVSKLNGLSADSAIDITTDDVLSARAYVASVNSSTNTITLAKPLEVALTAGDCIKRGVYNREVTCDGNRINNRGNLPFIGNEHKSYFRKIEVSMVFEDCEVNLSRYADDLGMNGALEFIKREQNAAIQLVNDQFTSAIFRDLNLPKGNTINPTGAAETLGLFKALADAQNNGVNVYYDFEECCDSEPELCDKVSKNIETLLDFIHRGMETGLYESGDIVLGANNEQLKIISKMTGYFEAFGGRITTQEVSGVISTNRKVPVLEYMNHNIRFEYEPYFDAMPFPFMTLIPRDQVGLAVKKYTVGLSANKKDVELVDNLNLQIEAGMPVMRFKDRTDFETSGHDDCVRISGSMEIAVIWRHTCSWAYLLMKNFGACWENTCFTCEVSEDPGTIIGNNTTPSS